MIRLATIKHFLLSTLFVPCCLLGQSVDLSIVPTDDICNSDQYCVSLQISSQDGADYIGTSSMWLLYDSTVLFFNGNSREVLRGSYTSINFDDDQADFSSECAFEFSPYTNHSFDGSDAGEILITLILLSPTIGPVFACPQIADSPEEIAQICFEVLDPRGNPKLQFYGLPNTPADSISFGSNFNSDANNPTNKHNNGDFIGLNTPFEDLCTPANNNFDHLSTSETVTSSKEVYDVFTDTHPTSEFALIGTSSIPTNEILTIIIDTPIEQEINIATYNTLDHLITTKSFISTAGRNHTPLDIANYVGGTYLLNISNGAEMFEIKFVKE